MQIRDRLILITAIVVTVIFVIFSWFHIQFTAQRNADDFSAQNFEELQKGDSFAIGARLNAMSSDGRWRCVVAHKNGHMIFDQGSQDCGWRPLDRAVEIKSESANGIRVSMIFVTPLYFKLFVLIILFSLVALIVFMFRVFQRIQDDQLFIYREIFDLARRTAHDIRSPLSVIQIVASVIGRDDPERGGVLKAAAERLSDTASDLLERAKFYQYSMDKKGPPTGTLSATDITKIINSLLNEKKIEEPNRNYSFSASEMNQRDVWTGNRVELQRILSNLLNNAIEATAAGGSIRIQMKTQMAPHPNQALELAVIDNGCGISKAILKKLGSRVVKSDKAGGSGIGVYFALRTLKSWGGDLIITSTVEAGTTATVVLKHS